jgi:hypothetical protein
MPIGGATTPWNNFKLEVAFASGPFDGSPVWTDITSFWRMDQTTDISRGRQSEQDQVQTGTMSLTLDNTDGRFTVGNTSSPYYPNVKLRKQIRITYTQGGTTYPIFKGYVDEWPVEWPDGGELYAWAQVRASDRFKPLGTPRTLRSVPAEEYLMTSPAYYFPLGESTGATAAGDFSGNGATPMTIRQFGSGGSIAFGTATGSSVDGQSAPTFTMGAADQSAGPVLQGTASVSAPSGITVETTFASSQVTYTMGLFQLGERWGPNIALAYGASALHLFVSGSDHFTVELNNSSSTGNLADGSNHHVALTVTPNVAGATIKVYADGVQVLSYVSAVVEFKAATLPTFTNFYVGGYWVPATTGVAFTGFTGSMSHYAITASALSASAVARHATAVLTGFQGESTGARVARVADWCGIATADRVIASGSTTSVRHVDTTGKTAQGFLQELADTEGGLVFIDTAGRLVFQARSARYNQTAALTLSTTQQSVSENVVYRSNDQFLRNDVTYSREGGITYRAIDATSIADSGAYVDVVESYTTSDDEVRAHAQWVVATSKTPTARVEGLAVDLLTDASIRVQALGLELSSQVAISGMPGAAPGATANVFVEGYRESISLNGWTREFNTSPADAYSPIWQLGVAGFSELGVTTRLGF